MSQESKPAIEVKGISKKYRITHTQKAAYKTMRDELVTLVKKPFQLFTGQEEKSEEFWALKNVKFEVNRGEVLGIIGRNGSGKSTLLKILSRITEPTEGEAILRGKVASLLEVGTGFHSELTGRENIYFNGSILGMTRSEISRKFDDIVAFSEVEQFLDTPVKFYSSGMYVRLAFAVAAHLEPDILIVDEVLAVGDAQFQKKSLGRMEDISKEGRTVIFVSHNMGAVRQLCTKGLLLDKGKGQYFDDVNDAISAYLTRSGGTEGEEVEIAIKDKGIKFSNFRIDGVALSQEPDVFSGDPLTFTVDYKDTEAHGYDLCVGYAIRSKRDGTQIVYIHNHLEEVRVRSQKKGKISVRIDVPKLSPDIYAVEFNVWLGGEHFVYEQPIGEFKMIATATFASNMAPAAFPSSLMVSSKWKFE